MSRKDEKTIFPYKFEGRVVPGHGRGSSELGVPTANLEESVVEKASKVLKNGIYYGECSLNDDKYIYYPMAMSIGINPTYSDGNKSLEVHVIFPFEEKKEQRVIKKLNAIVFGWLRDELKFESKGNVIMSVYFVLNILNSFIQEELIKNIHNDIRLTLEEMNLANSFEGND